MNLTLTVLHWLKDLEPMLLYYLPILTFWPPNKNHFEEIWRKASVTCTQRYLTHQQCEMKDNTTIWQLYHYFTNHIKKSFLPI